MKMLPENSPPGRKRPTPRYKPAMAVAIARTKAAKKAGLVAPDAVPSHMPAGRKRYDDAWKAKNPDYWTMWRAKRRQQRVNARALLEAPTNSPAFFLACAALPDFPRDPKEQVAFVFLKGLERGPAIEHSPPRHPPVKAFDSTLSVVPSRPRRTRSA